MSDPVLWLSLAVAIVCFIMLCCYLTGLDYDK